MGNVAVAFFVPLFVLDSTRDKARLWVDFVRETARTFKVDCYVLGADEKLGRHAKHQGCLLADGLEDLPGVMVMLSDKGEPLKDYQHPENVTYLLGPDDWYLVPHNAAGMLSIPMPTSYPLWSAVAAGICLNDRLMKSYSTP